MISNEKLECIKMYEEGLKLYRSRNFKDAAEKFTMALQFDPTDGPSKVFVERCEYFQNHPVPDDWDGVFEMKTK
jgi:hypothetical protein